MADIQQLLTEVNNIISEDATLIDADTIELVRRIAQAESILRPKLVEADRAGIDVSGQLKRLDEIKDKTGQFLRVYG